jgi:hypothetical protein
MCECGWPKKPYLFPKHEEYNRDTVHTADLVVECTQLRSRQAGGGRVKGKVVPVLN